MKGDGNHRSPPLCSQANYTFAQPGIQRMVFHLREIVNRVDPALYKHVNYSPGYMNMGHMPGHAEIATIPLVHLSTTQPACVLVLDFTHSLFATRRLSV